MILAKFVIKVYAPLWFSIKLRPHCMEGPKHIMNMILLMKYMDSDIKLRLYSIIQGNAFFAHPENILLALLADTQTNSCNGYHKDIEIEGNSAGGIEEIRNSKAKLRCTGLYRLG